MPNNLDKKIFKKFDQIAKKEEKNILHSAIFKNGVQKIAFKNESLINMQHLFSEDIKTGKITSQNSSGRCWLFAAVNALREQTAKKLKIEDFELSQTYLMFYDKLEKANYFLENIIKTVDEDIYSRIVMFLLSIPLNDGGQWDMFVNLHEKYGSVPKHIMPESFHSSNSAVMNDLLTVKLREWASDIREKSKKGYTTAKLRNLKEKMMEEFYTMLISFLGRPPKKFDFEYRDDDKKFHSHRNLTPLSFAKKIIPFDPKDYVSIINAPSFDKPFNKTYTVKFLGNVIEGQRVLYLNLSSDELRKLSLKQIKNKIPVWFGCDVGKMLDGETGTIDPDIYDYESALGVKFGLDKGKRLEYGESLMTHAMVLSGVNVVDGKVNRWKVENSWGEKKGHKGFLNMSDKWFDEFTYQVVINKKFLTKTQLKKLEQKPIELEPWDPMGSLAVVK